MLKIFIILFSFLYLCSGQILQFGTCTEVNTFPYFAVEKFLGIWYEIQRFPTWYEENGLCAYKTFEFCGRSLKITHSYIKEGIQYDLHINTTYAPGDDAVFLIHENNIDPVGIPLFVIDTDYTTYAVLYGCKSNYSLRLKYLSAWILSRTPSLEEEILSKAQEALMAVTYSSTVYLENVEHKKDQCGYHWNAHVYADYTNEN